MSTTYEMIRTIHTLQNVATNKILVYQLGQKDTSNTETVWDYGLRVDLIEGGCHIQEACNEGIPGDSFIASHCSLYTRIQFNSVGYKMKRITITRRFSSRTKCFKYHFQNVHLITNYVSGNSNNHVVQAVQQQNSNFCTISNYEKSIIFFYKIQIERYCDRTDRMAFLIQLKCSKLARNTDNKNDIQIKIFNAQKST